MNAVILFQNEMKSTVYDRAHYDLQQLDSSGANLNSQ